MNKRRTKVACAILVYLASSAITAFAERPPNILFILADDQRNDTLGIAGHPVIKTPTIDRLANEGVLFTEAFVTTPICGTSRASIFTGLYERTHGFTFGKKPVTLDHAATSYPAQLKQAGYRTGYIGKVHAQFEDEAEAARQMFDYYEPVSSKKYLIEQEDGSYRHETELCGERAIEFLQSNSSEQPFCLSVGFFAAHAVDTDHRVGHHFESLPELKSKYTDETIAPPRLGAASVHQAAPSFLTAETSLNFIRWGWRWDTPEKYDANMRDYFRLISGIDLTIARILQTLEAQGLADNTIIVYSADNGYMMGDRGMAGKWNHYDQAVRVPMIIYDPRLPENQRGQVRSEFVLNIDIAPTLLDYAGLPIPDVLQGTSLVPLIEDLPTNWRDAFYYEHTMIRKSVPWWRGIRSKDFSYAIYPDEGENGYECLYDLEKDPDQLVNVAEAKEYRYALDAMRQRLEEQKQLITERLNTNLH